MEQTNQRSLQSVFASGAVFGLLTRSLMGRFNAFERIFSSRALNKFASYTSFGVFSGMSFSYFDFWRRSALNEMMHDSDSSNYL